MDTQFVHYDEFFRMRGIHKTPTMNLSKNKHIPRESIFLRFTIEAKEKYRGGCLIIVIIVSPFILTVFFAAFIRFTLHFFLLLSFSCGSFNCCLNKWMCFLSHHLIELQDACKLVRNRKGVNDKLRDD